MNLIQVYFFANLKDLAGLSKTTVPLNSGATVRELKEQIGTLFPKILPFLEIVVVSVNREFGSDDQILPDAAEVAIFPPVSGGSTKPLQYCEITESPVDIDEIVGKITTKTTGAVCVFCGIVRGITNNQPAQETLFLEYEAYADMARTKMMQVVNEIRLRWSQVEGVAIVQRIGQLSVGTQTVVIACSASHRDDGVFEAARYGIDRLKQIVPIWKKEIKENHTSWVIGEYHPTAAD